MGCHQTQQNIWVTLYIKKKFLGLIILFIQYVISHSFTRPQGYKTFSMLNSADYDINPAHKC